MIVLRELLRAGIGPFGAARGDAAVQVDRFALGARTRDQFELEVAGRHVRAGVPASLPRCAVRLTDSRVLDVAVDPRALEDRVRIALERWLADDAEDLAVALCNACAPPTPPASLVGWAAAHGHEMIGGADGVIAEASAGDQQLRFTVLEPIAVGVGMFDHGRVMIHGAVEVRHRASAFAVVMM